MERVIFSKASVERKPEYRQQTVILADGEKRTVRKIPVGEKAKPHLKNYLKNYLLLKKGLKTDGRTDLIPCRELADGSVEFPFLTEPTLMKQLEGTSPEEYIRLVKEFRDALVRDFGTVPFRKEEGFRKVFGDAEPEEGEESLAVTNADLNFDNVFCTDDGRYILIDYEWVFPFPLPLSYLLYRAMLLDPTFAAFPEEGKRFLLEETGVGEEKEAVYRQMELAFLAYISPDIYKLDYFARIPGARKNVLHDFQQVLENYPKISEKLKNESENCLKLSGDLANEIERSRQRIEEINRLNGEIALYSSRLWFRAFRKLDSLRTRRKRGTERTLHPEETETKPRNPKEVEEEYARKLLAEMEALKGTSAEGIPDTVKFSVLVPLYNTPEAFLREMIQSVLGQTYRNWELCLADGSDGEHGEVGEICREYAAGDPRILYKKLEHNGGISENTNACMDMASGDYIALFDHDDLLHPAALAENAKVIYSQQADFIYSDEAVFISPDVTCWTATHFKPDYAPENLLSNNYICHLSVFRASLLEKAGRFRREYDGSQDHDIILRLTGCAEKVAHIPKILYFWRSHPTSTASDIRTKTYAITAGQKSVKDYLHAFQGTEAKVESTKEYPTMYHVAYPIQGNPEVNLILDAAGYSQGAIREKISQVIRGTGWRNLKITVITGDETQDPGPDPSGRTKVLCLKEKGRAKRLNEAVRQTGGEYLVFLDMELEPVSPGWAEEMLMLAQQEKIGAVGGRAWFKDDTLRHGGLILGLGDHRLAGRSHFRVDHGNGGYFGQLTVVEDVSAVSVECMMIRREKLERAGGFDPQYRETLFDVDCCLRLAKKGFRNVYTPFAEFRGGSPVKYTVDYGSEAPGYAKDSATLRREHPEIIDQTDPYYNPNLTLDTADYRIRPLYRL